MLKIGLTGGIGCGKTTVTRLFSALNIPVVDADELAHQLVRPNQPALEQIKASFGPSYINADGTLNRKKMRDRIYSDGQAKQTLEAILHPLVAAGIQEKIQQLTAPYCIISIPLLFEANMAHMADRVLVIDCPTTQQIERVQKRDNMPIETIRAIIDSQVARDYRLSKADDIIDNAEMETDLADQVNKLHHVYTSLSTL